MLKRYFTLKLKQAGFSEPNNIYYSLNHSQGDGFSFECDLSTSDVLSLFTHIYPRETTKAYDRVTNLMRLKCVSDFVKETDFRAYIVKGSTRYTSADLMQISAEFSAPEDVDPGEFAELEESRETVSNEIIEYAQATARALTADGYAIEASCNTENIVVWKYVTSRYAVVVTAIPEIDPDPMGFSDEECFLATCKSMIAGEQRLTCLKAEIIDATTLDEDFPTVLEESYLGNVFYSADDLRFGGLLREIVSQLIADFRSRQIMVAEAA